MKDLKAVLFDMDGVLVKSDEVWFRAVEEAGVRFRGRAITREEFFPTFGQGTAADVTVFGLGCSVQQLDAFYAEAFLRFIDQMWVNPEAAPLFAALRARGLRVAVVTNTVSPLAKEVLRRAALLDRLDALACADHVAHAKPAPDLVLHACRALGVGADEAWMVGDSRFDREATRAAGVHFVGFGIDGDARIERLGDLPALRKGG